MHCHDVVRQLAARTDDQVPADLAEHLAGCAACSEWANRAAKLDRLWEATRAPEPSPRAWDSMWDHIVESLDSATATRSKQPVVPAALRNGTRFKLQVAVATQSGSSRSRRRSFLAAGLLGLAQAAAVLFVVSIAWQSLNTVPEPKVADDSKPALAASGSVDATSLPIDIEEGSLVVIEAEGEKPEVKVLISENSPFGIDDWLVMFNKMESMDLKPVVAMKE